MPDSVAIDPDSIRALIPHQGAMCLLDRVREWSATRIAATASSHLDPGNPLRRDGRLAAICGCEYAFQAAALHGALLAGGVPRPAGRLAALQLGRIAAARLDDPAFGMLAIEATLELADPGGLIYGFRVASEAGTVLLAGRGTIVLPRVAP
jgi:predicted hotdog family 3-hydroxylacyl-ACP dehydratase